MAAFGSQASFYSAHAALYSDPRIRPSYPCELFDRVHHFAGTDTDAALDVATGTGQCARQLAARYDQVWAIDASEDQLAQCKSHPKIHFCKGLAEQTGLPDHSIDLVTAASALHWFDAAAFYLEARRVLKTGGALAAWTYYIPTIKGHNCADQLLRDFWHNTLGPYKVEAQLHCEREYRGLEPTAGDFAVVERCKLDFDHSSTIWHLVQFLRTSGVYAKMLKEKPDDPDPLVPFREQLMSTLNAPDDTMALTLQYSVILILAKNPLPL